MIRTPFDPSQSRQPPPQSATHNPRGITAAHPLEIRESGHPIPRKTLRTDNPAKPRSLKRRWFLSLFLAIGAGIVVAAAGELRYRATGTFTAPSTPAECRREFLEYLWQQQQEGAIRKGWAVHSHAEKSTIEVSITHKTPESAKNTILTLADGLREFLRIREEAAATLDEDTNRVLEDLIGELSTEAQEQSRKLNQSGDASQDPLLDQRRLRTSLADRVLELNQLRASEAKAIEQLDLLEQANVDQQVLVTDEDRQNAYDKRSDLVQDAEQLVVQLTQARRFMDSVWQSTTPHIDQLLSSAAASAQAGAYQPNEDTNSPAHLFTRTASLYQQRLSRFARQWTSAFATLREAAIDPHNPVVMERHRELNDMLGDFLYHAGKLMDTMHDHTRRLTESAASADGDQRTVAAIRRSFHRLESSHRQFEFAASDIRRRNNFRLDSALKSAGGLLGRIREEMQSIDAQLVRDAKTKWLDERKAERLSLATHIQNLRDTINSRIDEMIAIQDQLVETMPRIEAHLRDHVAAETARSRIAEINKQLIQREKTLEEFRQRGDIRRQLYRTELIGTHVDDVPANIRERMLFGLGAALATFVTCLALTTRLRFVNG